MKKSVKICIIIFCVIFLVFVIFLNYNKNFSPKAIKAKENLEHSYHLIIGMTENEVVSIMGMPDLIAPVQEDLIFHYDLNDDSKGPVYIIFDSTKKVKDIHVPK